MARTRISMEGHKIYGRFAVRRARIAWTSKRASRLVLSLARIAALILVFVLPVHTTMQQIACEHLPTSYGQAVDDVKAGKVLRAGADKTVCGMRASLDGDGAPVPEVAANLERGSGQWLTAELGTPVLPMIAPVAASSHLKRAPPVA